MKNLKSEKELRNTFTIKEWTLKNSELSKASILRWNREHPEKLKEYDKKAYAKEKVGSGFKQKQKDENRKYYVENKEKVLAGNKLYMQTHKWEQKAWFYKNELTRKVTRETIKSVYERNLKKYGILTCELCFKPIVVGQESLEHFIPLSRQKEFPNRDLNALNNLGLAHWSNSKENCNQRKFTKTLEEWFKANPSLYNDSDIKKEVNKDAD